MAMLDFNRLAGPLRIPFLVLTPACIFLGFSAAFWTAHQVSRLYLGLVCIGAISAHISVNAFNEYFDFKSGLDEKTRATPFSGGSGVLPAHPGLSPYVLWVAWGTLLLTGAIGVFFLRARGLLLLPLGVAGLLIIFAYTPWITRHPLLCLVTPGLAFGPLMVMGADFVLTGHYSQTAFIVSLTPFFLVNNLLLLNQFPDVAADAAVGRRTLPIVIGRRRAGVIYAILLMLTYLSVWGGWYWGGLPAFCLLGLLPIGIAIPVVVGVLRYAENIEKLLRYMGLNVVITISTPVLVGIGLLIAG
jgi:1,4-dihydroxy-2-naphthoate polyprenyltransferase